MKSNEKTSGDPEVNKFRADEVKKQLKLQKRLNKASHQTQQNEVTNQPTPVPHQPPPPVSTKKLDEMKKVKELQDAKMQQPTPEQQQQNENDKQQQQSDEKLNNYITEIKKTGLKVLRVLVDEGSRIPNIKDKNILVKTIKEDSSSNVKFPRTYYVIDSNSKVPILLVKRPPGSKLKTNTLKKNGNYTMEFDDSPTPEEPFPSHFVFGLPKVVCCDLYILILCHSCSVDLSSAALGSIFRCLSNIKTTSIWDVGHILRQLVKDLYGVKSEISALTGKTVNRAVQLETNPDTAASTKVSRRRIKAEQFVQRQMEMIEKNYMREVKDSIHFKREVHFQEQIMRLSTADNKANALSRASLTCDNCGEEFFNATTKRVHHMTCCIPPHLALQGPVISFNTLAKKDKEANLKLWKNMQPSLYHLEFKMKKQQSSSAPSSSFSLTTIQQQLWEQMKPSLYHPEFEANQQHQSSSSPSSYRIIPEHNDVIVENKKMNIISNNLQQQPSTSSSSSSYSIDINSSTGIQNGVTFQVFDQAEIDGLVSAESLDSDFDFSTYHNEEEDEEEHQTSSLLPNITTTTTTVKKRKFIPDDVEKMSKKKNSRPEKFKDNNNIHTQQIPSSSSSSITTTTTTTITTPSAPSSSSSVLPLGFGETFYKSYKWKRLNDDKKTNILKLLEIKRDAVQRGGNKPYKCQVCPESSYKSFHGLSRHCVQSKLIHPELPTSSDISFCDVCWDYFRFKETLYNHIVGEHPDVNVSNFKPFYSTEAKKTVKKPQHKCNLCGQSFFTLVALRIHHCIEDMDP